MDLAEYLDDKVNKTKYVRTMFDIIAPGYNAFTRLFSFGMDSEWKAVLVQETSKRAAKQPRVLDLACGTADLGIALTRATAAPLVLCLDLSVQMLGQAKSRLTTEPSVFVLSACDMLALCLADASVDVVTIGYGLRNAGDARLALAEIARVLRLGGILANLDFYRPVGSIWRELFLWYMWHAGRLAGWLWHREPTTYGYLAPSIRRYFSIAEFAGALAFAGFEVEWSARRLGGAIGVHIARYTGVTQVSSF